MSEQINSYHLEQWVEKLEAQLKDAQEMRDEFHRREQAACKKIEELAPIARESRMLKFDLCRVLDQRDTAREQVAQLEKMREAFAALVGCARDNNWEGVEEGLHAYAWQAFIDSQTGKADQIRQWARLWKRAAQKYYVECWRLRGILKGERMRREDAERQIMNNKPWLVPTGTPVLIGDGIALTTDEIAAIVRAVDRALSIAHEKRGTAASKVGRMTSVLAAARATVQGEGQDQ